MERARSPGLKYFVKCMLVLFLFDKYKITSLVSHVPDLPEQRDGIAVVDHRRAKA
jgi:hypothetical protein